MSSKVTYPPSPEPRDSTLNERDIEDLFIEKLRDLCLVKNSRELRARDAGP